MGERGSVQLRYEFRVFDGRLDRARAALDREGGEPGEPEERTDLYLVAPGNEDVSLKLKGHDLDLKLLRGRRGDLELWAPAGRAVLPLDGAVLRRSFLVPANIALQQVDGAVPRAQLVEIARSDPRLRLVEVAKRRTRRIVGQARAELASVRVDGQQLVSIAVESESPDAVESARRRLGLSDKLNVSYPRLLANLAFGGCDAPRPTSP